MSTVLILHLLLFLAISFCSSPVIKEGQIGPRDCATCEQCMMIAEDLEAALPTNATQDELKGLASSYCGDDPEPVPGMNHTQCLIFMNWLANGTEETTRDFLLSHSSTKIACIGLQFCIESCCLTFSLPEQVHISMTDVDSEMVVMWTTDAGGEYYNTVEYGAAPGEYSSSVEGFSYTYSYNESWVGFMHRALLTDLIPGKTYHYRVGAIEFWSEDLSFKMPERFASKTHKIAMLADMGVDRCSDSTVARLTEIKDEIEFVYHSGDMAYIQDNEFLFDVFFRKIQPINVPYMTTVGNHEEYHDYIGYANRVKMPTNSSLSTSPFWYSWNYGPVHFCAYSTEHDLSPGSEQYRWILNDLRQANEERELRPWLIMTGHKMIYCSTVGSDCQDQSKDFQEYLEPVISWFGVDIVVNGHMHSYERTLPVAFNVSALAETRDTYYNPNATVYFIHGNGGAHSSDDHNCDLDTVWYDQPTWSAKRFAQVGYSTVEFNRTHWHYTHHRSSDNAVIDDVVMVKTEPLPYWAYGGHTPKQGWVKVDNLLFGEERDDVVL